MMIHALALSGSSSRNGTPGSSLPHPVHLCIGSLVASGPAKVVGWKVEELVSSMRPTDLWGTYG
jgi:hypothetical protein